MKNILTLLISMCFCMSLTNTVEKSFLIGLFIFIIVVLSNLVGLLFKNKVNEEYRTIFTILETSVIVTIISFILYKLLPNLFLQFKYVLPLTSFSLITLEQINSKENKIVDVIKTCLLFLMILVFVGFIRELFGNNTITIMDELSKITGYRMIYKNILPFKIPYFLSPSFVYILLGLLFVLIRMFKNGSN